MKKKDVEELRRTIRKEFAASGGAACAAALTAAQRKSKASAAGREAWSSTAAARALRNAEIVRLYKTMTASQVAEKLNVSISTVQKVGSRTTSYPAPAIRAC